MEHSGSPWSEPGTCRNGVVQWVIWTGEDYLHFVNIFGFLRRFEQFSVRQRTETRNNDHALIKSPDLNELFKLRNIDRNFKPAGYFAVNRG